MIPPRLSAGQRSHVQVLYDSCLSVECLGFSKHGWPIVRRVDHRKEGDPARDVTYAIAESGRGVTGCEVVEGLDHEGVYEMDELDFNLLKTF